MPKAKAKAQEAKHLSSSIMHSILEFSISEARIVLHSRSRSRSSIVPLELGSIGLELQSIWETPSIV